MASRAGSFPALNDGSVGSCLLNQDGCLTVQVFLSGTFSPEAHVSPATYISLISITEESLRCFAAFSTLFLLTQYHLGTIFALQCFNTAFSHLFGLLTFGFFLYLPVSSFGKEDTLIKQSFLWILFSEFYLLSIYMHIPHHRHFSFVFPICFCGLFDIFKQLLLLLVMKVLNRLNN